METTRWDLSNDMSFVLVYCCGGMLMTSCFWGSTPILGRKRITLLQPCHRTVVVKPVYGIHTFPLATTGNPKSPRLSKTLVWILLPIIFIFKFRKDVSLSEVSSLSSWSSAGQISVIYFSDSGLSMVNTRGIQYFCPFAFKARSTTLIFVECITFHQTSLLDDVHKVLVFFHRT